MNGEIKIVQNRGHWEVYLNGEFFCSADSYIEAARELDKERNKHE